MSNSALLAALTGLFLGFALGVFLGGCFSEQKTTRNAREIVIRLQGQADVMRKVCPVVAGTFLAGPEPTPETEKDK